MNAEKTRGAHWICAAVAVLALGACNAETGPCPDGAALVGSAPPDGYAQWCARADKTKHGPWTEWHDPLGMLKVKGQFVNGKMEGTWTTYHETDNKKSEGVYVGGLRDGVWTLWNEQGVRIQESVHNAHSAESSWTAYRTDGQVWAVGTIVTSRPHGVYQEWHANGQLAAMGEYEQGSKVGQWRYFTFDGEPSDTPQGDFVEAPDALEMQ